jgi:hypothetical protein
MRQIIIGIALGGASLFGAPDVASACSSQNTYSVRQCISAEWRGQTRFLVNSCNRQIEAVWCYQGVDCRTGSRWWANSWTIPAGRSYPLRSQYSVRFSACRYTFWD